MGITDAEIEAVARQMYEYDIFWSERAPKWTDIPLAMKDPFWKRARAAILASRAAVRAKGYKVLAREPTEEMKEAGGVIEVEQAEANARGVWRTMCDAAPEEPT